MQATWLTPTEIFTPYYGHAISNFILDKHSQMAEHGTPLRIFEIGRDYHWSPASQADDINKLDCYAS